MALIIDLSHHNKKVPEADAYIIRAGYGKNANSDKKYHEFITKVKSLNKPYGFYWFSYALSPADAKKEAIAFYNTIVNDYKEASLPLFYDFEYDSVRYAKQKGVTITKQLCTAIHVAFLSELLYLMPDAKIGVYLNDDYDKNYINLNIIDSSIKTKIYIWYAKWVKKTQDRTASGHSIDFWQFTSNVFNTKSNRYDGSEPISSAAFDCLKKKDRLAWAVVKSEGLNIRKGPGVLYKSVAVASYGDGLTVNLSKRSGSWIGCAYKDVLGYVNSKYIEIVED